MSLLDELKKLTKPYDDDADFIEDETVPEKEIRGAVPKQEPRDVPPAFSSGVESGRRFASSDVRRDNKSGEHQRHYTA
jgi:hypothetical protein